MKTFILTLSIAMVFAACSNNQPVDSNATSSIVVQDTSGLAQFKDWKQKQDLIAENEIINNDGFETEPIEEAPQKVTPVATKTRVIYRESPVKERKARVTKPAAKEVNYDGERTARSRTSLPDAVPSNDNSTASNGSEVGTETGSGDVGVSNPAEVEKDKNEGWSKAAKGTAIGAGSGAVLGAILSKNKTKGAAVGGVIGAAGGYIFGRKQDKKDGRY